MNQIICQFIWIQKSSTDNGSREHSWNMRNQVWIFLIRIVQVKSSVHCWNQLNFIVGKSSHFKLKCKWRINMSKKIRNRKIYRKITRKKWVVKWFEKYQKSIRKKFWSTKVKLNTEFGKQFIIKREQSMQKKIKFEIVVKNFWSTKVKPKKICLKVSALKLFRSMKVKLACKSYVQHIPIFV